MNCPECDANMNIPEDAAVGEIVSCGEYDRNRHTDKFKKQLVRPDEMMERVDTYNPIPDEVWKKAKKL